MKIGIFGGSFDPCHNEHVNMALSVKRELMLDKLIVVPAGIPPHKQNQTLASPFDRVKMLALAFEGEDGVEISDFELNADAPSYTYKTVERFKSLYPEAELYFLVGSDMLADFPTWREPQRILSSATLVLTEREGEDDAAAVNAYYGAFDKPFIRCGYVGKPVSSTAIRARACLGLPLDGLTPKPVADYIASKGLYRNEYSDYVIKSLPIKRLTHTFGVMVLAVKYAKRLKVDPEKAFLAAMLHDVAKYLDPADLGADIPKDVPKPVVHQFLGAFVAEKVLKVSDEDIINAIKFHTTGRPKMSTLEKIIFTADLLEEGRTYEEAVTLRRAVDQDFDSGFEKCVERKFEFAEGKGAPFYKLSAECVEYYCKKK